MVQRKKNKKRLKWRLLFRIAIAIAFSMTLSSFIGYRYFNQVVKEQKIADELRNQQQVVNQINFMNKDIKIFAKSVIVDLVLQENFNVSPLDNEFQRLKKADTITKRMVFYNSLKDYIASSFIYIEEGQSYISTGVNDEDRVKEKLMGEVFLEFNENPNWTYSTKYISSESWAKEPVICYRADMWDIEVFGRKIGTFYTEIYLEYFTSQVQLYSSNYDNVCLLGNNQEILFKKDADNRIQDFLLTHDTIITDGVYKGSNGYFLFTSVENSEWKLCTLLPDDYLWDRSKFVLNFFVLSFIITVGLVLISSIKIIDKTILPITKLSNKMSKSTYDKIELGEIINTGDEIQTLYECYQMMILEIERGIEERIKNEKLKREMEFDIMLSQTNPHYLYNVLNTIVYMAAAENNKNIVSITNSLIYTLQATLSVGEHDIYTTVADEIELTNCYINIQKYRYPESFEVEISCPEEIKEYKILKTSIQPLVENAIIHGILPTYRTGVVKVKVETVNEQLIISVIDNGQGINEKVLYMLKNNDDIVLEEGGRKHIGINNIKGRIKYLYGSPFGMEILKDENDGTEVRLILPIKL